MNTIFKMVNIDKILKKLKNRKVFRSVVIYGSFAFLLIQVYDFILFKAYTILGLSIPDWTITFIILLIIIGIPILFVIWLLVGE